MSQPKSPRLIATLAEIQESPGMYLDQVVWVPTDDLLAAHHPENPRDHAVEDDVAGIFRSLLWFGWGEYGMSFNPRTGRLTGGHGRSMAAELGRNQDLETFEKQWERWLKEDKERKEIAELASQRFQPSYWEHCPVMICLLSVNDQRTLMVRLNEQQQDGKNNPAKMAALLAELPKPQAKMTGFDLPQIEAIKSAFLERLPEPDPMQGEPEGYNFDPGLPPEEGTEYQEKQRFERPDATDYSGDSGDPWAEEEESGEVRVTTPDGQERAIAQVDTSQVDESVKADGVFYDSNMNETRAVLRMTRKQLAEFKGLFGTSVSNPGPLPFILDRLGRPVDLARSVQEWRPDVNLAVLNLFVEMHPELVAEWEQSRVSVPDGGEDDGEEEE